MLDVMLVGCYVVICFGGFSRCCGPFLLPHAILQHPYSLMLIQSHQNHHETIMVCPVLQIHDVAISWAHPGTWQVGKVGQIGLNNNVGKKWWGSVSLVGLMCFLFDVCKVPSFWNRSIKNRLCNNDSSVVMAPLDGWQVLYHGPEALKLPILKSTGQRPQWRNNRTLAFYRMS